MTIQKILIPTDFSQCSQVALDAARALAAKSSAKLHVMHAWDTAWVYPEVMVVTAENQRTLAEHAESEAEAELADYLKEQGGSLKGSTRRGPAAEAIVSFAKEQGFDLIVMGTHGRTGLSHLVLGSVAQRVLRHAPCPVLTCPDPKKAARS